MGRKKLSDVDKFASLRRRLSTKQRRDTATGCLIFTGFINGNGYGEIGVADERKVGAHRAAAFLAGIITSLDDPAHVCHKCDNPPCTEPEHLYAGNYKTNRDDAVRRGRDRNQNDKKTHCVLGHPFSGSNLLFDKNGYRVCKECRRIWRKRLYKPKERTRKTHCKRGHLLAGDNLRVLASGYHVCKTCGNANQRAYSARNAEGYCE